MDDRRKMQRTEISSRLIIKQIDGNEVGEVAIEVTDISKTGVGFSSTQPLSIGAVYEGFLTIWTKEVLHAFIEIVRIEKKEDMYDYGAIFIGMPEMEANRIEIYQTVNSVNK